MVNNVKNNNMSKITTIAGSEFGFYSTRQAAEVLGVSVTTIQLWVEAAVLPAWKTAGGHRRIPRAAVDSMRAQQSRATEGKEAPAHNVLVVDDDAVQRELYQINFAEWKLPTRLLLAGDGFEGLVMAGKYLPNLIIADLSMPGMDGFEMIRRMVQSREVATAMLIVVTGLNAEDIEAHGGLPEDIPVYAKPIAFAVLKQIVKRSLLMQAA